MRGQSKADAAEDELKVLVELEKGGDTTAMLYNEGAEALRLGDAKTARERFEKVLELKPDLEQVRGPLMVIYIKGKEYEKAAAMADLVLSTKPNDVTAKRIRYDAYKGLGDTAKAKEAFDALATADPKVLIKGLYEDAQAAFNNNDIGGRLEAARPDQLDRPQRGQGLVPARSLPGQPGQEHRRQGRAREVPRPGAERFAGRAPPATC